MGIVDYIEQKNRERVARARFEDSKKVGFGLVLGTLIGAGIGVLTAPKSGAETRADLADRARDAGDVVRAKAEEYRDAAVDFGKDVNSRLTSIKPAIESGLDAANSSFQENKSNRLVELGREEEELKEKAEEVKKGVENVKDDVKKGAQNVKDDVKKTKDDVVDDVKKAAEEVDKKNK
ncbi:MAG: YtxH domain-containing protein [Peptoniphilaceae bacterium]|nr:YtxH domain-containing protein [Peptoniphilaceae bacterium]MDY6085973.1 YtxH domain-containing protein [Peptoniphilaceae bacterium]